MAGKEPTGWWEGDTYPEGIIIRGPTSDKGRGVPSVASDSRENHELLAERSLFQEAKYIVARMVPISQEGSKDPRAR